MGWCNPDEPCESCGRTQEMIDKRKMTFKQRGEAKARLREAMKPKFKRKRSKP